jgi:uncharacterized protein YegP (UPF0339 family)
MGAHRHRLLAHGAVVGGAAMKFQFFLDVREQWRWRLVATNGRILADSAEAYSTKGNVERAIETVVQGVSALEHLKGDPSKAYEELSHDQ